MMACVILNNLTSATIRHDVISTAAPLRTQQAVETAQQSQL